jgi:quinol monooxygenase YgiN
LPIQPWPLPEPMLRMGIMMKDQSEEYTMNAYGCYVKFTARPGQRDALVEHLLRAAAAVAQVDGCEIYLINASPTEPECVWVTEVWRSQHAHDASLTLEGAQELIKHVLPLLAGSPEKIDVVPVGGKGVTLA